jgi:hypothetical protein
MVVNSVEGCDGFRVGLGYHFLQGIKNNVHTKTMLAAVLLGKIPVGFHYPHNFYIPPLFTPEYPVYMRMDQPYHPNP